jgi:hypothetical protein
MLPPPSVLPPPSSTAFPPPAPAGAAPPPLAKEPAQEPYPGPTPYLDLSALSLAAGSGGSISARRRLQQSTAPLALTAWPNTGTAAGGVTATAVLGTSVLGAGGSVELANTSGTPYVTLTDAYLEISGTLDWDTTAGGGWTVMAVVSAPTAGPAYERVLEFSRAGATLVDGIILGRDDSPAGAAYAVTGAGGASDRPVFASFGAEVFGAGWRVLTATTNATSWALLVDGAVVASGNTSKPVASRTTDQGYIGKSSNPDIGLANGLQIRQLAVWFEPLSTQQLADLHSYIARIWGMTMAPPAPLPSQPPPPNTCGVLPGGWESHCPSCAAGTTCLQGTCTTGLKASTMLTMLRMLFSVAPAASTGSLMRRHLPFGQRPPTLEPRNIPNCRRSSPTLLPAAPTSAACRPAPAPATPQRPALAAWPRLTWPTGRPTSPPRAPSAAPSPSSPLPPATWW